MDKLKRWSARYPEFAYTCALALLLAAAFALIKAGSLVLIALFTIALSALYFWGSVKSAYFSLTALLLVMLFNFSIPAAGFDSVLPYLNDNFSISVLGIHPHFIPESTPSAFKLYDLAVLLASLAGVVRALLALRDGRFVPNGGILTVLMYVFAALWGGAMILSFAINGGGAKALGRLKNYIQPLCLLLAFHDALGKDSKLRDFKRFLLYAGTVLALMQVINIFRIESVYNNIISKSVFNTWGASNTIVPVYLAIGATAYPEVFPRGQKKEALLIFEFALLAACAFLTLSRGGVVAAAIGLCAFFLLFKWDKWLPVRIGVTLAVSAAVLIAMTAIVWGIYNPAESQSVIERGKLINSFTDGLSPITLLFGQGLAVPGRDDLLHNDYLQVFSDGGLLAFAGFAGFMTVIFLRLYRRVHAGGSGSYFSSLICAFAGWTAHCFVEPVFSVERLLMLFILLVAAGMSVSSDRKYRLRIFKGGLS